MTRDVERAQSLLTIGKFEEALEILGRAVADDPDDAYAWCLTAWAASSAGRPQQAIEAARTAVTIAPEWEYPYRQSAIAFWRYGHLTEAVDAAEKAVACDPTNWRCWQALSDMQRRRGHLTESKAAARKAVELAPESADCWSALGFAMQDEWDEAVAAYEQALKIDPERHMLLNDLAWVYMKQERVDEAEDLFRRALQIDPSSSYPQFNLAVIAGLKSGPEAGFLAWKRAQEHGLAVAEEGIRRAPAESQGHSRRAFALMRLGRTAEAIESARTAITHSPESAEAWRMLSWGAAFEKRWKLARYAIRRASDLDPENPFLLDENADIAYHAGRAADHATWAKKMAEGGNPMKVHAGKAHLALDRRDHGSARSELEEIFRYEPWHCCYRRMHAWCCSMTGDDTAAALSLRYAIARAPECRCPWGELAASIAV
jgi:superkiller protein 3